MLPWLLYPFRDTVPGFSVFRYVTFRTALAAATAFVLSLVLIYLREKTGSLWASITLHAIKNGVAFVALFALHGR